MNSMRIFVLSIFLILLVFPAEFVSSEEYVPYKDDPEEYVYTIGAGDILEISVWGYDELTRKVTVRPDGMITYETVGDVHAAGLTPTQLSTKLVQKLSDFLRKPNVIVKVIEIKSQKVTVIGEITSPGSKYLKGPTRLLDLLTSVGWSPVSSKSREVIIMRKTGQVIKIDLEDLLYRGNASQNVYIKNRDTIILPTPIVGRVNVNGEVASPGEYEIEKGKNLYITEVLRLAGGPTNSAVLTRAKIIRKNGQEIIVNLAALRYIGDQNENYRLHDGDRLFIPRVRETKIYVFGRAQSKGVVTLNDPTPRMDKLIAVARHEYFAVLSSIKVIRDNPANPGHPIVFDVDLKRLMYLKDSSQNIKLENYDVVYIPQSFMGSFAQFLDEVWPTITEGAQAANEAEDIAHGDFEGSQLKNRD